MIRVVVVWAGLLVLLALNVGLAHLPLGRFALPVALGIAGMMAVVVLVVPMELDRSSGLVRAFAAAGFVWLAVLIGLSATDYGVRRDALLPRPDPAARDRGAG